MSKSRIIRKFERFLFKGVPEQAETVWQKDDNANATVRETGKSQESRKGYHTILGNNDSLGYFEYDFDTNKEIFHSTIDQ